MLYALDVYLGAIMAADFQTPQQQKHDGGHRPGRILMRLPSAQLRKAEPGSVTSCVRQKICFERTTASSLPLLLKKEERAGERRCFLSISPLSDSLPARSSRGERGKTPQAFCVPNTT